MNYPSKESIASLEQEGLVTVREHSLLPLRIVNYTPKAQYERAWIPDLLQCRGLVYDDQWKLVARPLPKFFNYEEHVDGSVGPLPSGGFTVTEKYDGSLGILFKYKGQLVMATRGSFHSEQADEGMRILLERYSDEMLDALGDEHTHLLEICYPANRIVVDYGGQSFLQWLTTIHTASGIEEPEYGKLFGGIEYVPVNSPEELKAQNRDNAEGYVLRYENGQRVKIKFEQYVMLHKLVSGLDSVAIWECLKDGKNPLEALTQLPDELYQWARSESFDITNSMMNLLDGVANDYNDIRMALGHEFTRKDFASLASKKQHPSLLFLTLDNNPDRMYEIAWKLVKPERRKPTNAEVC